MNAERLKKTIQTRQNSVIAEFMSAPADVAMYHASMDALMPVINKINSMGYRVIIGPTQTQIFDQHPKSPYHFMIDADYFDDIIKNTYSACYTFAKWYKNDYLEKTQTIEKVLNRSDDDFII